VRLELGTRVRSSEGEVIGKLEDVVIDPVRQRLTHLVVKPDDGSGQSRLVSIDLAEASDTEREISLRCTADDVHALPNIEEFAYLRIGQAPVADADWDVGVQRMLALPYFESAGLAGVPGGVEQDTGVIYDRIPKGEVEFRRSSGVFAADGHYVGDVDGFLVDDEDHITHFVLERGHLWGRREVTVPIGAVTKVESDKLTVGLSTDEIGALPTHRVHRWPLLGGRGD
jgi:sporulation protein YlmC with PRC-barrel domain